MTRYRHLLALALALVFAAPLATATELSPSLKRAVLEELRTTVRANYVVESKLAGIDSALAQLQASPELAATRDEAQLAALLDTTLQGFDLHFGVRWRAPGAAAGAAGEDWFTRLDRQNSGFRKVEVLAGNIGYIETWGMDNLTSQARARAEAAMQAVVGTDALIFDLRDNGGGSGEMVQLLASYLFAGRTHLNSIQWRPTGTTTEYWTLDDLRGAPRPKVPVYVLTCKATFSAAEEFAYDLQQRGRALVVGERSKGGANPWKFFEMGHGFRVAVPIAQAINPVSGRNWEHVGVAPDVAVDCDQALAVALALARGQRRPAAAASAPAR